MNRENVSILLVEDDQVDVKAFRRALNEQRIANPVYVASDGIEALRMLRGEHPDGGVPHPYLILLDLNMPRMNGFEFLEEVRQDPKLHQSIIFVLTTSMNDNDRAAAYDKHIAGYLVKSEACTNFVKIVQMIEHFVLVIQFPPSTN